MNCYNGARYVRSAIQSVYSQTFNDWEIVFIDNNSVDNSAMIAQSFDERLRYYKTDRKLPLYAARNVGIRKAEGQYIAFLDTDDIWLPTKLEKQIDKFSLSHSLVFTDVRYIDEAGNNIGRSLCKTYRGEVTSQLLVRNFIPISSVISTAELLKRYQFNEAFNLIGDYDMWLRLSIGHKIDFVNEVLTLIRIHPESTGIQEKNKWATECRQHYREFFAQHGLRYPAILLCALRCELGNLIRAIRA